MADYAKVYSEISDGLLTLLSDQLPYSLSLLRRLQFTKFEGGLSPTARVVFISQSTGLENDGLPPRRFTAAYIEVGGVPDTQMWIYSTLEHPDESASKDSPVYEHQLARLVDECIGIAKAYNGKLVYPGAVLLGTLHDSVREILTKSGRVEPRSTGAYDKWLFRYEDIPGGGDELPGGLNWGTASEDDCRIVVSRTDIPRTVEVLSRMPSLVIKLDDGTPVSWAFLGWFLSTLSLFLLTRLGFDGSLVSLHCEEPYRRRGLAKALAAKLFREKMLEFADDGWCSADVAPDNDGSRGMLLEWIDGVVAKPCHGDTPRPVDYHEVHYSDTAISWNLLCAPSSTRRDSGKRNQHHINSEIQDLCNSQKAMLI
ncbi:hypothetical protein FZEAL_6768 [Fusarium zealandicum]|uniref:Uncharacterized protein n=1 Tax=Fusarium zealandicum TaxID=1053134 RepID=A0A8H4UH95_9HYPO|nr:hypothetical protein FZEAL_6768 [Fusarium zealandicum]